MAKSVIGGFHKITKKKDKSYLEEIQMNAKSDKEKRFRRSKLIKSSGRSDTNSGRSEEYEHDYEY